MENLYCSLDKKQREIRLVTLDPGSDDDPLCCSLEPVSLDKQPPYEAVSYVWGNSHPNRCKPIVVNKQLVPIPRNLEKALQNLKSPTSPRTLWADAIYINQSDEQERTHQVELMNTIYKSASKVLIWLGSSNAGSKTAFAFIRNQKNIPVWEYQQYMEENHDHYATSFEALCKLLKRGWFTRVWTVQEFAFGRDPQIICGKDELDWSSFYQLGWKDDSFRKYCLKENYSSPLITHFQKAQEYWGIVSTRQEIRQYSGFGYQLHYLLHATAYFAASDPRDRIYALLGLSNQEYRQEIKPDYTRSKDEVYIKVVKCIIKTDKSLNILAFQASPRSLNDSPPEVPDLNDLGSWALNFNNLPSWVPDFSVSLSKHCRHLLPRDLEEPRMRDLMPPSFWVQYWATGRSRPIVSFSIDSTHLSVKGVRFGRVCEVVGPFGSLKSYLRQAEQCARRAVPKSLPRGHLIRVLHRLLRPRTSLWRAFIADKDETGSVPAPPRYKTTIKAMLFKARIPASPTSHCASESPHLASVERSLQAAIENRRFFRTDYRGQRPGAETGGRDMGQTSSVNTYANAVYAPSPDHKTSKNCTMEPPRIQVPDNVLRMTSPGSRRTTFTTKKAEERSRLESEDRKAKLEIRALRRAEAGSRFHKELEKSDGAVTVGDLLLRKLAAQENTLDGLSGKGNNSKETVDHGEGREQLERMKRETVEALTLMRDL